MATATTINRTWIAAEFSKGIEAEQSMMDEAKARAESPPDEGLGVVYHEIARADERHCMIVETIATRYGHTPARSLSGGIGETLGRLKDKVEALASTPMQRISHDLMVRASAIHWCTAWVNAFQAIGDVESARELETVQSEQQAHTSALLEGLSRLVLRGTISEPEASA